MKHISGGLAKPSGTDLSPGSGGAAAPTDQDNGACTMKCKPPTNSNPYESYHVTMAPGSTATSMGFAHAPADVAVTTTSHDAEDDDVMPTQIDTVTLKRDLNDYLINLINVSCSLAQSDAPGRKGRTSMTHYPSVTMRTSGNAIGSGGVNGAIGHIVQTAPVRGIATTPVNGISRSTLSSYTLFDELVRCTERERELTRMMLSCRDRFGVLPRMRLCGGGEDSINNGTSAWGTPPGATTNGSVSAWGILPNQQQSLPPPAWGSVGSNGSSTSNSSNNNSTSSSASNNPAANPSANMGSHSGNSNGNNSTTANVGSRGSLPTVDPNFNKTNAQPAGTPAGGPVPAAAPLNAWNTSAPVNHRGVGGVGVVQQQANVTNNNGNHHNHHHHHGQNHNHHQQQQQQPPAGPNPVNNGASNNNNNNDAGNNDAGNGTAKNQLEVLNTMREALFAQDGWGCQHVNQDTNWEVPGSPEPHGATGGSSNTGGAGGRGDAAASVKADQGGGGSGGGGGGHNGSGGWKPYIVNNGTELWETNLRNGPAPPNQQPNLQQAKGAPWVPANNLGGTWMEDDNGAGGGQVGVPSVGPDGVNVWNGSAAAIVAGTGPPHVSNGAPVSSPGWAAPPGNSVMGAAGAGPGMWPPGANLPLGVQNQLSMNNPQVGVKKDLNEWGSGGGGGQQGPPGGIIGVQPVGGPGAGPGQMAQGWGDGRAPVVTTPGGLNLPNSIGQSSALSVGGDLRGDPRGISGRLNGAGSVGGGMGWGVTDQIGGKLQPGILPSTAVSGGGGTASQSWGSNNGGGGMPVAQNKLPSSAGGGWDDGRSVPPLDDGGAMLWGQGNASTGNLLSRQNSTGWKEVPDSMMRGGGGAAHLQRSQSQTPLQGGGPFGPVPVPSGVNSAAGVRFGGGGGAVSLGKPDGMWGQGNPPIGRNGSWEDGPGWGDDKWNVDLAQNGGAGWNKTSTTPKNGSGTGVGGGWPDQNDLTSGGSGAGMDWCLGGGKSATNSKPLGNPLEFVRTSKEFRLLCEMGFKKEDVEISLRATGMVFDDAMELLRSGVPLGMLADGGAGGGGGGGGWRRPLSDDHGGVGMGYDAPYSGRIPPLNHPASGLSFSQNNQNMLNNIPGGPAGLGLDGAAGPANLAALNNLKYLSQQQGSGTASHPSFNHNTLLPTGAGGGGRGLNYQQSQQGPQQAHQQQQQLSAAAAAQPSNQQLRMLVQQIQLAVQNGFLNHQILNQPLAPQTLVLLNQLLNHIKQMQLTQSNLARSGATGGVSAVQLTLAINKHKTQIAQFQQQIAAQQSIYLKQQQQQGGGGAGGGGLAGHQGSLGPPPLMPSNLGMDFLRQQQHQQQDLMALQGNFGEMALVKEPIITSTGGVFPPPAVPPQLATGGGHIGGGGNAAVSGGTSQQSRLNQWKLPSLEKVPPTGKDDLTDFSRAPGPTAAKSSTNSTNLSSLGLVQDGTWTTGRTNLTDGWPEHTGEPDSKEWASNANTTSSQDSSAYSDLVPEFEPGKPWKGTQLKIEDDPSITPGSVARSPLSITTAKESELFGGVPAAHEKVSPPSAAGGDGSGGGLNLTSTAWSFHTPSSTSVASGGKSGIISSAVVSSASADVWCTPIGKPSATRGPPPGLGGTPNKGGLAGGGWSAGGVASAQRGGWGGGTSWLLLKNLTSQIDASTLRTLCMQHGPILSFHSYPAHGLALCRYSTREEATKAQQALNNCPLGSGTISAECPGSESEVQTYLQQLGSSVTVSGGAAPIAVSSSTAGSISSISSQSWRQRGSGSAGTDAWSSGWPIGSSAGASTGSATTAANLWAPLDTADHGTPSSLNSFLPESLLGPELN